MEMDREEKILALQLILEDIRGNWGFELEERVDIALQLAEDLSEEYPRFLLMVKSIKEYQDICKEGDNDGRYFRTEFPYGYEGMGKLHGLKRTYNDKSKTFKLCVNCLTYPENSFIDWEEK